MTNNFTISLDLYTRRIQINLINKKYSDKPLKFTIKGDDIVYQETIQVSIEYSYYNFACIDYIIYTKLFFEIFDGDELIHQESMSFKNPYGGPIRIPAIYIENELGLGDIMAITPIMRKLHNIYEQRVTLIVPPFTKGHFYEFMFNNPDMNTVIKHDEFSDPDKRYDTFHIFTHNWNSYYYSDLRQLCAHSCGMTLKENEMDIIYVPFQYEEIENLPEHYVVINPAIRPIDRNWEKEQWQELADKLNSLGIYVVSIGRDLGEEVKTYYNLDIKLGLDLCGKECQNSISQTWHIINKSDAFIGFDTGIYILAGSTDTHIILLGWYGDPFYHQPYRNGNRNYKFSHIRGNCDIFCLTDPKYDIAEHGTATMRHPVLKCVLNLHHRCKPTPQMIFKETVRVLFN